MANKIKDIIPNEVSSYELILISFCITLLIYSLFFYFSEQIWDHYSRVDPASLAPAVRQWVYEHDGIEAYIIIFICQEVPSYLYDFYYYSLLLWTI
ncbi:MAG: hypothetical protein H0U75_02940 [Legionella sp.]|nr:hypothetical protein [Legionella sp.]